MPQKLITVLMPSANALWVPLRPVAMRWRSKLFPLDGQCTADPAGQWRDMGNGVTDGTITHALPVSTCGRANFHTGWVSVGVRHAVASNLTLAHRKLL
jgi:hypothetical protein